MNYDPPGRGETGYLCEPATNPNTGIAMLLDNLQKSDCFVTKGAYLQNYPNETLDVYTGGIAVAILMEMRPFSHTEWKIRGQVCSISIAREF